jgi:HEAT repeat protein
MQSPFLRTSTLPILAGLMFLVCLFQPEASWAQPTLQQLLKQLKSRHSPIRLKATQTLASRGKAGLKGLFLALEDRQWRIRDTAAKALFQKGPSILPALAKALRHTHPRVRLHSAEIIGKFGPRAKRVLAALHGAMHDREWGVRVAVTKAIGQAASRRSLQVLSHHLQRDPYWRVRALSAQALATFAPTSPTLRKQLLQATKDRHEAVRYQAALALLKGQPGARTTAPALVRTLQRLMTDTSWRVRWAGADGLGQLGPIARKSIPALQKAFADKQRNIRETAAISLAKMGRHAKHMIPTFVDKLERDDAMPLAMQNLRSPVGRIMVAMRLKKRLPYLKYLFGITRALATFGRLAVPELQRALRRKTNPNPWLIFTLGCIGKDAKRALPMLLKWSRHTRADYRWMAVLAMSRVAPTSTQVRKALWNARKDPDEVVRKAAAQALAECKDPRFLASPAYQALIRDTSRIRLGAKNLIHFMKSRSMTPTVFLK